MKEYNPKIHRNSNNNPSPGSPEIYSESTVDTNISKSTVVTHISKSDKAKTDQIEHILSKIRNNQNKKRKNKKRSFEQIDEDIHKLEEFKASLPRINLYGGSQIPNKKRRKHKKRNNNNNKNKNKNNNSDKNLDSKPIRVALDELTTGDEFMSFEENVWFVQESLIPSPSGNNITQFFGIYNKEKNGDIGFDDDDKNGGQEEDEINIEDNASIGLMRFTAKENYGFSQRYKLKKWYKITGGQLQIYNGKRTINMTSVTKIEPLRKQLPAPDMTELLCNKNIQTSLKEIVGAHDQRIEMMSIVAWVRKFEKTSNWLAIELVDASKRRIRARDWNAKTIPDVKPGTKVLLTNIKRTHVFSKIEITINGPYFFYEAQQHKFQPLEDLEKCDEDLSSIDYEEEYDNAKPVTMQQCKYGTEVGGNYGDKAFYKMENVRIKSVSTFFSIRDEDKNKMTEGWRRNTVIDGKSGRERKLRETDDVEYWINLQMECMQSRITLYMTGFKELGEAIFNTTARKLFATYSIAQITESMNQTIGGDATFNLLMTYYEPAKRNKRSKKKGYWTIQRLLPPRIDSDYEYHSESNEDNEDDEDILDLSQ